MEHINERQECGAFLAPNGGGVIQAMDCIFAHGFIVSWCGKPQPGGGMHPPKPRE